MEARAGKSELQGTRKVFGMDETNESVVGEEYPMCSIIFLKHFFGKTNLIGLCSLTFFIEPYLSWESEGMKVDEIWCNGTVSL